MSRLPLLLLLVSLLVPFVTHADVADRIVRTRTAGIDLIVYKTDIEDVVTFRGAFPAGDCLSPQDNLAIATLTGAMLDKGTTTHSKFEIAQQLEGVGASLSFSTSGTLLEIGGKCLKKDLPLVIGLLAEQLRTPAFSNEELAKIKKQLVSSIQRSLEDPGSRADQAFAQTIYPVGHPNYQPPPEEAIAAIEAATAEQLKAFHAANYGPAHFTLVAVGDVEASVLEAEIKRAFSGWAGGVPLPAFPPAGRTDAPKEVRVFMPDKTSVSVVIGQATGLKYADPDALALRLGTTILGSGFTGRLMSTVRDREGLTYGIGASVGNDTNVDGDWQVEASFAPELLAQGLVSTRRELSLWLEKGVTPEEVEKRKSDLIGRFKVGLATTDGLAGSLLTAVQRGLDVSWIDEYPRRIEALTAEQVNAALKRHIKLSAMTTIEAGTVTGAP